MALGFIEWTQTQAFTTDTGHGVWWLTIVSMIATIFCCMIVDNVFVRHFFKGSSRYFVLHVIFNSWIVAIIYEDSWKAAVDPLKMPDYAWSAVTSVASISGYHVYHLLFFTDLSTEDLVHHIVSCIIVPAIGVSCPFGYAPSLSNLAMCGLPGGIDYAMLALVKVKMMDSMTEKYWNVYLNLIMRWPIQFLSTYVAWANFVHSKYSHLPYVLQAIMLLAFVLHAFNAVYYARKVTGNYFVREYQKDQKRAIEEATDAPHARYGQSRVEPLHADDMLSPAGRELGTDIDSDASGDRQRRRAKRE